MNLEKHDFLQTGNPETEKLTDVDMPEETVIKQGTGGGKEELPIEIDLEALKLKSEELAPEIREMLDTGAEMVEQEANKLRQIAKKGVKPFAVAMATISLAGLLVAASPKKAEARDFFHTKDKLGLAVAFEGLMGKAQAFIKGKRAEIRTERRLHYRDYKEGERALYLAGVAKAKEQIKNGQGRIGAGSVDPLVVAGYTDTWNREKRRNSKEEIRAAEKAGRARGYRNYQENRGEW